MSSRSNLDLTNLDFIENKILSHYNIKDPTIQLIKFKDSDKQRAIYKIRTPQTNYCLKKIYYSKYDLEFVLYVMNYLNCKGMYLPKIIKTKSLEPFVNYKDNLFFLMTWIEGRKCNYDRHEDLRLISENLARLHQYSVGFDFLPQNKERYNYSNWFIDFNKKATKLLQLCNQIYNTLDYDPLYYSIYSIYHDHKHIINKCLNLLSTANCKQLMMQAIVDNTFCHLDYVNKNLYLADQKVYMIDFDRTKLDITIHDLSSLLRRVLRRKSIQWDFEIAQLMIDSYRSIQPLSKNELKAILAYVIFPQKFFTELKRYVKDQSNTLYYTERFHKIAQQYKNKDLFISQFENYYNINKGHEI